MKNDNKYGAVIERGKVVSASGGGYVIKSLTRDGITTLPLASAKAHAVGETVYYCMFGDGAGKILDDDLDGRYLKLSGGTMSGAIKLAATGLETANEAGYSTDQYGNFVHSRDSESDFWNIKNNAGTATFGVKFESGEVNYGSWKATPVEIAYGGTGQTTQASAINALVNLGVKPIASTADDTTAKWKDYRPGIAWYNSASQITDQPSTYGYLMNVNTSSGVNDVHQLWFTQTNGDMLHRGGNANGWSGTWKTLLDSSNYSSYAATSGHNHDGTYLKVSGGTMTGQIIHKASSWDVTSPPSSTETWDIHYAMDSNGKGITLHRVNNYAGGKMSYAIGMRRQGSASTADTIWNVLELGANADGTRTVTVSDASAWRSGIGIGGLGTKAEALQSTTVNIASATYTKLTQLTLAAGTWVLIAHCSFNNNATGYRWLGIGTAAATSNLANRYGEWRGEAVDTGAWTVAGATTIVSPTASTTYYLNVYQTSGGALGVNGGLLAVRII